MFNEGGICLNGVKSMLKSLFFPCTTLCTKLTDLLFLFQGLNKLTISGTRVEFSIRWYDYFMYNAHFLFVKYSSERSRCSREAAFFHA